MSKTGEICTFFALRSRFAATPQPFHFPRLEEEQDLSSKALLVIVTQRLARLFADSLIKRTQVIVFIQRHKRKNADNGGGHHVPSRNIQIACLFD